MRPALVGFLFLCLAAHGQSVVPSPSSVPPGQQPVARLSKGVIEIDPHGHEGLQVQILDLDGRYLRTLSGGDRRGRLLCFPLPDNALAGEVMVKVVSP
ncbi:MAG: hypothetical protein H6686_04110 [Fibrobacteria bacterium]|nr:hypothetical protein [Fibrobacteria bacterium]